MITRPAPATSRSVASVPLSGLDALFLHLDSPRTPMHAASVAMLESEPLADPTGRLRIDAIREEIESRLDLVPKLRRLVMTRAPAGPVWVDDPGFDIAHHVSRVTVPSPGTESTLAELCGELLAMPIDRTHPPWELWFVDGLRGRRVVVVAKLHHALADGLGDVELATLLFGPSPSSAPTSGDRTPWLPRPAPATAQLLATALGAGASAPLHALSAGLKAVSHPHRTAQGAVSLAEALSTVMTPRSLAPHSSLNRQIGAGRRVAFVRQSLPALQRAKQRFGVTLNDIVLSAVCGGVHELYEARGEPAKTMLQVLVPVGMKRGTYRASGNEISAMVVRLPLTPERPLDRLQAVAREMSRIKRHHQALVGTALVRLLEPMPQPALAAVAQLVHHQPFVNLVVTNVPGPSFPLSTMGARILEVFPFLPLAGNLSVGVAALSYCNQLSIGLIADRAFGEDLEVFATAMTRSFAQLTATARGALLHPGTARSRPGPPRECANLSR